MPYRFCIASLCLALGACSFSPTKISSLDEDQRQQIAYTTLYNQQGRLDHAAYAAALQQKLSASAQPAVALQDYARQLGGHCRHPGNDPQRLQCLLPKSSTICLHNKIRLSAVFQNQRLQSLSSEPFVDGC